MDTSDTSAEWQRKIDSIIDHAGEGEDEEINLANVALALGALDSPGLSIERYQHHIQTLCDEVALRFAYLIEKGADDDAGTRLASLKHVIADQHGYIGDEETYDDLQNVNLIRVIERQKGMPIALAILYFHVGLSQGWDLCVVDFPVHVVCRIQHKGQIFLFDPFNCCEILQAANLRNLLKQHIGQQAELRTEYYAPSSKRDVLIRLQNNIKLRLIEAEEYEAAAIVVERMMRVDPDEYRLLLDAGVLYARTNQALSAIDVLEDYIERTPNPEDQHEALALLREIRTNLH